MAEYFLNLTELKYDIIFIRNKQYWARRSGIESKPLRKMKKKDNDHLVVYLGTGAVSILAVVQSQTDILPQIVGIAVYVLAAVSLTAACICFYRNLRKGVIERMLLAIRKTPLGARFLEDYTFRTILTTMPAFLINVAYTVYNGVIGIMNRSAWFITMAVYYSFLGIMRYHAVNTGRKISRMEDQKMIRRKEISVIRTDGILLLLLNLSLAGIVLLTIVNGTARTYPEIMVISIAAYTFYKMTIAVINMVKVRKLQSPILITIRNIGVADALVSMLTLQMTMLASFQEKSSLDANYMNGVTGLVVSVLIVALGVGMIYQSYKREKSWEESESTGKAE